MFFSILLISIALQAQTRHAVGVGVAEFDIEGAYWRALEHPSLRVDVIDFKEALIQHQNWQESEFTLVLDHDATKARILNAFQANTELFFGSAHGDNNPGREGLITTLSERVNASEFMGRFSGTDFAFFVNSCYSGYFCNNMTGGEICASSAFSEPSTALGPSYNHTVYFHFLIEGVENNTAASNGQYLTPYALHQYLEPLVIAYTTSSYFGGTQHPKYADHYPGTYIFNKEVEASLWGDFDYSLTW